MNEVTRFLQEPRFANGEVSCDLFHPLAIRTRKDPGNLDPPGLEIDDEGNEIPNQARSRLRIKGLRGEVRGGAWAAIAFWWLLTFIEGDHGLVMWR